MEVRHVGKLVRGTYLKMRCTLRLGLKGEVMVRE